MTSYSERERDFAYMGWVKWQACCVPGSFPHATPCWGVTEADHPGNAGLSNKVEDARCIPLCVGHHRERTDHTGTFATVALADEIEWRDRMSTRYRAAYERQRDNPVIPF